ncbi:carbon-nitrogen hydrolase family protein [Halalkalibacterium ligniniphilum]|uniref:carbon-nitrogen hydrolase family protein n=1 Tax=Halalkalibacterium ligniniphilum TaxID=1134413 RepID=UPI00034523D6|nr:carbon-nitrogen hydrolase family protein [Halalkalibacterium ligniniphilum]
MSDIGKKYLAAAVQMAPVWLDREATTEKVCSKIIELGQKGVRFIVFPEVMIPGTPHWNWSEPMNRELYIRMFQNSVEVPSETLRKVATACRSANAYVVLGITEREAKALYNTIVFINNEGQLIGKHRKMIATQSEKVIWAAGDASGLRVHNTPLGKIGGLICGEHNNSLARYALAEQGEEVHAAVWVSGAARRGELYNRWVETWCQSYAMANQTFVICAQACASEKEIERFGFPHVGGGSSIIAPDGSFIAGPEKSGETDVIAEIDFEKAIFNYTILDTISYHGRPDLFQFGVNRETQSNSTQLENQFEKYDLTEQVELSKM